ncbi:MAG: PAC2 family protein [Candidatus Bathyarchaeia archaeon]|nr:PAC2 family protein [Candidatus Bathyarchaeota archaeon]
MLKTSLRIIREEGIEPSILLVGVGEVGYLTLRKMRSIAGGALFAHMYTPYNPDYTDIDELGLAKLNSYEWYYISDSDPRIILVEARVQPSPVSPEPYYEIAGLILDYTRRYRCRLVVALDGIKSSSEDILAFASRRNLLDIFKGYNVKTISRSRVEGLSGLIVGLARIKKIDAVGLIASFVDESSIPVVSSTLLRLILSAFKIRLHGI